MESWCTSAWGGAIVAHSIAVMPTPHTSTLASYVVDCWAKASGAIQCGVPTMVPRLERVENSWAATPKSQSRTPPPAVTSTLAALISRSEARKLKSG